MKKTIWSEIVIAASPAEVWAVLADISRYRDWNPLIERLKGRLEPGERLDATLVLAPDKRYRFRPVLVRVFDQREIRWIGRLGFGGLFDGEHSLALEPAENDGTRFVHQETFYGILVPFLWPFMRKRTEAGFAAMNEALRRRVESGLRGDRIGVSESH